MKPFDYWPQWAADVSMEEGWILTNDSSERATISRLDAPSDVEGLGFTEPKFDNDALANEFVSQQASTGSPLHLLAIWLQGYGVEDELEVEPPKTWRAIRQLPRN